MPKINFISLVEDVDLKMCTVLINEGFSDKPYIVYTPPNGTGLYLHDIENNVFAEFETIGNVTLEQSLGESLVAIYEALFPKTPS